MAKFADHMEKMAQGVARGYKKIENGVVTGYKNIENGVVTGYKKIESGVVEGFGKVVDKCGSAIRNEDGTMKTGKIGEAVVKGYQKVENAFVDTFLAREGETVEDAKARLAGRKTEKSDDAAGDAGENN